jgi:hypothetical protein
VLDRFRLAARETNAEAVVRITADCPLLDPAVSGRVLAEYAARRPGVDYVSNVHPPTYPDGLDTEVFSVEALETAAREARLRSEREHVTPFIWSHPERFRLANVEHAEDLSEHRWTVDTDADLRFVREVFEALGPAAARALTEVLRLLTEHPALRDLNAGIRRNEGSSDRSPPTANPLPGGPPRHDHASALRPLDGHAGARAPVHPRCRADDLEGADMFVEGAYPAFYSNAGEAAASGTWTAGNTSTTSWAWRRSRSATPTRPSPKRSHANSGRGASSRSRTRSGRGGRAAHRGHSTAPSGSAF